MQPELQHSQYNSSLAVAASGVRSHWQNQAKEEAISETGCLNTVEIDIMPLTYVERRAKAC
jgi:hypothetical protein